VGPKSVITSCDTQPGHKVVKDSPDGSLPLERCVVGLDHSIDGNENDKNDIEPVDVLIPILPRHGQLGDVRLLAVHLLAATGVILASNGARRR